MKRILILSGTHPRHAFVHSVILESGAKCAAIVMEREDLIPKPPDNINPHDKSNFSRHFQERYEIEQPIFGQYRPDTIFADIPIHRCTSQTLNTDATADFVTRFSPDLAFIFGTDLIREPLLSGLPVQRINLHLGLSPWYRGSATLFWPFYLMQPQFAGATFHQILPEADAGEILHQCVPELRLGDGIHDVGARTVQTAREALKKLIDQYLSGVSWEYHAQRSSGRLFLTRDFQPAHLRVVYDIFENRLVDAYMNGILEQRTPYLAKARGV